MIGIVFQNQMIHSLAFSRIDRQYSKSVLTRTFNNLIFRNAYLSLPLFVSSNPDAMAGHFFEKFVIHRSQSSNSNSSEKKEEKNKRFTTESQLGQCGGADK